MLDVSQNALLTIAGTGGVGFAGDGGLGREALLRHPEGLALKPNLADGQEVLGQRTDEGKKYSSITLRVMWLFDVV